MRACFALVFLLWALPVSAATYYVGPAGSDANTCATAQTEGTPKLTIDAGMGCLSSGDTLIVKSGTYPEAVSCGGVTVVVCADVANVTLRSQTQHGAIIDGNSNTAEYGILTLGSTNGVTIDGFRVRGVSGTGIHMNGTGSTFTVTDNWLHDIGRVCSDTAIGKSGIFINESADDSVVSRNLFDGATIGRYANGENGCGFTITNLDHGIYIRGADNLTFSNNVLYGHAKGWPVHVYPDPVTGLKLYHNTFAFTHPTSWATGHILIGADTTNLDVANNISYDANTAFIYHFSGMFTTATVRTNRVFDANTFEPNSTPSGVTLSGTTTTTPSFISITTPYNFSLQASSNAIDAGLTLAAVTDDYAGTARPQNSVYDLGAYEIVQPPITPTVVITGPTADATWPTSTTPMTTLSGTSSDDGTITGCTWSNDRGGSGSATGTTSWSVASITLQSGANVITVTCTDNGTNTGNDSITVTYTAPGASPSRLRVEDLLGNPGPLPEKQCVDGTVKHPCWTVIHKRASSDTAANTLVRTLRNNGWRTQSLPSPSSGWGVVATCACAL